MNKYIILLSKDATLPEYFGVYGSKYNLTPNIDEIANKGTKFNRHYAVAPSTAMSFIGMFTAKYPHETPYAFYGEVANKAKNTLFDILHNNGYECHLFWSKNYIKMADKYSKCYGDNTIRHEGFFFNQKCGFNSEKKWEETIRDDRVSVEFIEKILSEIDKIDLNKKLFIWIHMPHCIKGRKSYGDDIDIFDRLVGEMRKRFGDKSIYITADHGHMNGFKGITGYAFDVYEPAIRIPLITPRIDNLTEVNFPTSNVQLSDIILNNRIEKKEYVISDTKYYAQKGRKTAIISNNFVYIYSRKKPHEELYDLDLDPNQNINLLSKNIYKDKNRKINVDRRQLIFYPYWDDIDDKLEFFRKIKKTFWKKGGFWQEATISLKKWMLNIYSKIKRVFKK